MQDGPIRGYGCSVEPYWFLVFRLVGPYYLNLWAVVYEEKVIGIHSRGLTLFGMYAIYMGHDE